MRPMIGPVLVALERLRDVSDVVTSANIGLTAMTRAGPRWFIPDGYLTHVVVPFLDSDDEVEVTVDEDAQQYQYVSLQQSRRVVTRPLAEIVLYQVNLNAIFDHLASMLNIRQTATTHRQCLVPGHLWYLGEFRIGSTPASAPIFYGRALSAAPASLLQEKLTSAIHEHAGIVLTPSLPTAKFTARHQSHVLDDFLLTDDEAESFDVDSLTRVLAGKLSPVQYLRGNLLMLPHFSGARLLSDERKAIVKAAWGLDGAAPPITKWVDVNVIANTGYQSFDDAFEKDPVKRDEIFERVDRGKYRLRRNP